MEAMAVIPARGGSVRVRGKNMQDLGGKPIVQWTIEAALRSRMTRVCVATEEPAIAALALRLGCDIVPRNVESAQSSGMSARVVMDALDFMADAYGYEPDRVCLLHPTSPFRTERYINKALDVLDFRDNEGSVISVTEDELNGAVYLCRTERFRHYGTFFFGPVWPLPLDVRSGMDIDTWEDLDEARRLVY